MMARGELQVLPGRQDRTDTRTQRDETHASTSPIFSKTFARSVGRLTMGWMKGGLK